MGREELLRIQEENAKALTEFEKLHPRPTVIRLFIKDDKNNCFLEYDPERDCMRITVDGSVIAIPGRMLAGIYEAIGKLL
jgi:hypothetical protein